MTFDDFEQDASRPREEVDEIRQLWEGLGRLPQAQPSPSLRARFYQNLHAKERILSSTPRWTLAGRWGSILAVFVLGGFSRTPVRSPRVFVR